MTKKKAEAKPKEIVSVKGFNKDFTCRGFQFEVGKTYKHTGHVIACESGFHAIEGNPLEVFGHYSPSTSRYAEVIQSGKLVRGAGDSKIASAKITIGVELQLHDIIQRAVKWVFDRARPADVGHNTGDYGASSNTGYGGASSNTGDYGASSNTGTRGASSNTGYGGASSNTGNYGASSSTGLHGASMAIGINGAVMGSEGNALFLVFRNDDGSIAHAWAGIAGRDGIKPGIFYKLGSNGQPVQCPAS